MKYVCALILDSFILPVNMFCLCVSMCTVWVPGAQEGKKRPFWNFLDLLELKFVEGCSLPSIQVLGTEPWASASNKCS